MVVWLWVQAYFDSNLAPAGFEMALAGDVALSQTMIGSVVSTQTVSILVSLCLCRLNGDQANVDRAEFERFGRFHSEDAFKHLACAKRALPESRFNPEIR